MPEEEIKKNNKVEENNGESLSLLDGARSEFPLIAPELDVQRKLAADRNRSLEERLEAFEDIIDSEIGDTNLNRARNIEREFNIRQIYLKFEGTTPTGTQKDRIAFAQVMDALRRGYDTVTVATDSLNVLYIPWLDREGYGSNLLAAIQNHPKLCTHLILAAHSFFNG